MSKPKLHLRKLALLSASMLIAVTPLHSQKVDQTNRIVDEGMNRSEVMQTAHELVDGIGGRLSNSPQTRQAEDWAIKKFQSWGLKNVRREGFDFGRGWSITSSDVFMTSPRRLRLTAIPIAWSPPTNGTITA